MSGQAAVAELGPRDAWRVLGGRIEVFARRGAERTHLATVEAGELILGCEPHGGIVLETAGSSDAKVAADAEPPERERLEGWVSRLASEASGVAPKAFTEVQPGAEVALADGRAVRAAQGVAWVRLVSGQAGFLGQPDLVVAPGELLALPETAWLVAQGEAQLAAVDPGSVQQAEAGYRRFVALYFAHLSRHLDEAAAAERERLLRQAELDRALLGSASARLAAILTRQPIDTASREQGEGPLLAACRLVAGVLGLELNAPRQEQAGRKQDLLAAVCAASRVERRRVILRGAWWRNDNGPLLGFLVKDESRKQNQPVALLPTSAHGYDLVDPAAGTRTAVDAAVAASLAGEAYMFYPPLPDRELGPKDLVRAGLRQRRRDLLMVLAMGLGGGLLGLLLPILTGQIFGSVIPGADRPLLLQITVALVAGSLGAAAFQVTRSIAVLRLGGKIDGSLQAAVWQRLLNLPVSFFRRYSVGDLANRAMGIDAIRDLLTGNVLTSILGAVFSVFSFVLLFYYSWRLALLATALVAVLLGTTGLLVWLQLRRQREQLRLQGRVASLLFGLISGIGKLRIAGAEQRGYALWAREFGAQRETTIGAQKVANVQSAVNGTYGALTSLALFAMVGFSSRAAMPLGEFLAFNAAFGQFLAAALSMIGVFSGVLAVVPVYERLAPILTERPEVDATKADPGELAGAVEFNHVTFRYQADGPLILDDVSFRAEPGEFIALVGPSGAGKSTCLRLILGFEKPSAGSIYFDGQDLWTLSLQAVRRQLGVVLQTGRPMVGNIYSNIVGSSNLSLDDAWEAARMAGLEDDIKAMPMGMHTLVSEGAETFSGGQKQRLLIARAIVLRPRIVLFDEATSALDNRTQETVTKSLERLKATRIVIAHRLSTIQRADRIYVFSAGRVAEQGSYQELMAKGGVFTRLASRQIA